MIKIRRIKAKRPFIPTSIPGASYVINQYVGCQHACKYCYAKYMGKWYGYEKWGSWIIIKENMAEIVKGKYVEGKVYMSSASDAYQPIEKRLELTRNVLQNMDKSIKLVILTKSDLVLRDIDIFKEFKDIEVGLTINSFEGNVKRSIEPFSPSNQKRIKALMAIHQNGIKNYAFISPIIPHLTDVKRLIDETKDFVDFYWFEFLNLKASGSEFKRWLKQAYPESYEIISNKSEFEGYINEITEIIKNAKIKFRGIVTHYPKIKG
jgi:DNA repair photolyase